MTREQIFTVSSFSAISCLGFNVSQGEIITCPFCLFPPENNHIYTKHVTEKLAKALVETCAHTVDNKYKFCQQNFHCMIITTDIFKNIVKLFTGLAYLYRTFYGVQIIIPARLNMGRFVLIVGADIDEAGWLAPGIGDIAKFGVEAIPIPDVPAFCYT